MKKFTKFICKAIAVAAAGAGAYLAYKKFAGEKPEGEEDEIEDDLDEYELKDEPEAAKAPEYVSVTPKAEEPQE